MAESGSNERVFYSPSGMKKIADEYARAATTFGSLLDKIETVGADTSTAAGSDQMGKQFHQAFQVILGQASDAVTNVRSNVQYAADTMSEAAKNAGDIEEDARTGVKAMNGGGGSGSGSTKNTGGTGTGTGSSSSSKGSGSTGTSSGGRRG